MASLLTRAIKGVKRPRMERRELLDLFATWQNKSDSLEHSFTLYVNEAYKANGVVFAVILARMLLFSEARFQYRNLTDKEISGGPGLGQLEQPWPNGTTGELLSRMEQDVSLAGNAYVHLAPGTRQLQRLRPDWTEIVTDGRLPVAYLYTPGGKGAGKDFKVLPEEEVVHWSPIPDPLHPYRGMSWLTPIVREIEADKQMTRHKQLFFENAATPNLLIKIAAKLNPDERKQMEEILALKYGGVENVYRTMLVDGGADTEVTAIGHSFEQMSFATTQAAGENRICVAGNVPAIVVGLKEGLQAATYSNFGQAMRKFGTTFARPQWRSVCAALAKFGNVPQGAELWYDASDIAALWQDEKDAAEIFEIKAKTAALLIRAGYDPEEAGRVAESGKGLTELAHSGAIPVTLYPDGRDPNTAETKAALDRLEAELRGRRDKIVHRNDEGLIERVEEVV